MPPPPPPPMPTYAPVPPHAPAPTRPPDSVPEFVHKMANLPLSYGTNAYFECQVHGHPPPEILWTRRGHPLVDKTRSVFTR